MKNIGLLRSSIMSIALISLVTMVYMLASFFSQADTKDEEKEETEVKKVKKNGPDGHWRTGIIVNPKAVNHQFPATRGSQVANAVSRVRNFESKY